MERRDFINLGILSASSLLMPSLFANEKTKKLILIELTGGNDGVNTVIPYGQEKYYELRPSIAIPKENIITINDQIGFHPKLSFLNTLFKNNQLSIIQNIGYQDQNMSHFRGIEIWESGSLRSSDGWLSKTPQLRRSTPVVIGDYNLGPVRGIDNAIVIEHFSSLKKALQNFKQNNQQINNKLLKHIVDVENNFLDSVADVKSASPKQFKKLLVKNTKFEQDIVRALQTLKSKPHTQILKLSLKGFDTHANQKNPHAKRLEDLNNGLKVLVGGLKQIGEFNNTSILTYSEFGRRVYQNSANGTDHGKANVHFFINSNVKQSIHGKNPNLSDLDKGNLKYEIDFREIYKSLLKDWFQYSNDKSKLQLV